MPNEALLDDIYDDIGNDIKYIKRIVMNLKINKEMINETKRYFSDNEETVKERV